MDCDPLPPDKHPTGYELDNVPANGLGISRAALIDRESIPTKSGFKIATILGPRSGVGYMPVLDGGLADGFSITCYFDMDFAQLRKIERISSNCAGPPAA